MTTLEVRRVGTPTVAAGGLDRTGLARPVTGRATIVGLLVAATAPLWVLAPEGASATGYVAPIVAVPLLAATAVWRIRRPWACAVGGAAGIGLLVAIGPYAVENLGHVDSFFDFFPAASLLVGAALAAGGALAAAVAGLRGRAPSAVGERVAAVTSVAVLLSLGLLSGVLTVTGQHTVSALDRFGAEPLRMVGFEFAPAALHARAGRTARFVVRNDDLALHTFTIDELGVDVVVKPGREALVEFPAGRPGTYTLYCRPHTADGEGMAGTLTIR